MKVVFSHRCLEYYEPGHPESPIRVRAAYQFLKERGYEFVEPTPASEADLLKVHTKEYVERIKSGRFWDPDTPAYENIYEYARLSAGGAILAARIGGFSLMRPPGHHAGRSGLALGAPSLGFCYFNNIAIAIRSLDRGALIVDIDGHHGNGTQEIFLGDDRVWYVSLHRSPLYPGTGLRSEKNCLNFPLPRNAGDELYLKALKKALEMVDLGGVEVVGISAGFDAHAHDPLASLGLTSRCYRKIGQMIASLGRPVFAVLEGGYNPKYIGLNIHELIQGLEGAPPA